MRPSTTNYSERYTDVELMQTITAPKGLTRVHLSFMHTPPKMVTGMQKMAQRFTLLLLTRLADIHFDQEAGTTFLYDMFTGATHNAGMLGTTFALSSVSVINQMMEEDQNVALYGPIPKDEQIASAELESFSVDYATATLALRISLENVEGDAYTYVMPVTVART